MPVTLYTKDEIEKIRHAGSVLAKTRRELFTIARAGVSLLDLDALAYKRITEAGCKPAFLGYKSKASDEAFPGTICASVNEVIVHSPPTDYKLRDGDILTVDLGVIYDGYYSDSAWSIGIGNISEEAQKLLKTGEKCLSEALLVAKAGQTLGDIGHAVQSTAERAGFHVVKGLTGHGIGKNLHEPPNVFNEGQPGEGMPLEEGMVLAIEPMLAAGTPHLEQTEDGGYQTKDGSLSIHFEHTVAITKKGGDVLTQ